MRAVTGVFSTSKQAFAAGSDPSARIRPSSPTVNENTLSERTRQPSAGFVSRTSHDPRPMWSKTAVPSAPTTAVRTREGSS